MNGKIKGIIYELLEIEKELDRRYRTGNVDVIFFKGEIIEARHVLERLLQDIEEKLFND